MVRLAGFCRPTVARLPDPHQHLAVAGDDHDRQLRLRQRQAEADHDRAAHRAPQREIAGVIAGRGEIVGGGAEAADDERVLAVGQQRFDHRAAVEKVGLAHFTNTFVPIRRCDSSTAVAVQAL